MKSVTLNLRYDETEYRDAVRRHFGRRLSPRRDLAAAAIAVAAALAPAATEVVPAWVAGALAAVAVTRAAVVVVAFTWIPGHWWRSQPKLRGPYELVFSEAGVAFKTDAIDSTIGWSHHDRLVSDDRWHFLYDGSAFTAVPRRAFAIDDEESRFLALARAHVGAAP